MTPAEAYNSHLFLLGLICVCDIIINTQKNCIITVQKLLLERLIV